MKLQLEPTQLRRSAATVALSISAALPLAAQGTPPVPTRAKATTIVRVIDTTGVPNDSLRALIRAFLDEPVMTLQSAMMKQKLEAMLTAGRMSGQVTQLGPGSTVIITGPNDARFADAVPKGWLGFSTAGLHSDDWTREGHVVRYIERPVIATVEGHSPAQLAGILPGDVLLSYDGQDVVGHDINLTQLLKPERKVQVMVKRDGETKEFSVTVSKAPGLVFTRRVLPGEPPGLPEPGSVDRLTTEAARAAEAARLQGMRRAPFGAIGTGNAPVLVFSMTGVLGASLSTVTPELARAWKIEPGALVNGVPENTPAYRAGLRAGDVIIMVAGQPVTSVDDVRMLAMTHGENNPLSLQIIRDKKQRTITVP